MASQDDVLAAAGDRLRDAPLVCPICHVHVPVSALKFRREFRCPACGKNLEVTRNWQRAIERRGLVILPVLLYDSARLILGFVRAHF
jgi:hypothetical protein